LPAHSRRLTDELMATLLSANAEATVVQRDLHADPPPAIDAAFAAAMLVHQTAASALGVAALAVSERLIAELEASDVIVLGTPMNNFTVPAVLKLWIDQVVRIGRTFRSTPDGKFGLLRDRPTFIVVSSGGYFQGERARQPDFLTPYLTAIFNTIGIHDISVIALEGLSRNADLAYEAARGAIASHPRLGRRQSP